MINQYRSSPTTVKHDLTYTANLYTEKRERK